MGSPLSPSYLLVLGVNGVRRHCGAGSEVITVINMQMINTLGESLQGKGQW